MQEKMKIICFGDSNTWGYEPRGYWGGRYDAPWPQILAENTGWTVVNLGENGREIPSAEYQRTWAEKDISDNFPADLLIILLGTNDVLNSCHDPEVLVRKRMDQFLEYLSQRFPELPILLLVPMPVRNCGAVSEQTSLSFPAIYRALAEKYRIRFADCSAWNLPLAFDGVHLTEMAHVSMAEQLQRVICEIRNT